MDLTTNLELNKPESGFRNWADEINANWDAIDTAIAALKSDCLNVYFYRIGGAIYAGTQVVVTFPFACTLTACYLRARNSGSVKVDIWKGDYASAVPADANSICGGNEPEISSGYKDADTTLTSWTKAIVAGDSLVLNIDSCTSINGLNVALYYTRT